MSQEARRADKAGTNSKRRDKAPATAHSTEVTRQHADTPCAMGRWRNDSLCGKHSGLLEPGEVLRVGNRHCQGAGGHVTRHQQPRQGRAGLTGTSYRKKEQSGQMLDRGSSGISRGHFTGNILQLNSEPSVR